MDYITRKQERDVFSFENELNNSKLPHSVIHGIGNDRIINAVKAVKSLLP